MRSQYGSIHFVAAATGYATDQAAIDRAVNVDQATGVLGEALFANQDEADFSAASPDIACSLNG